MLRDGLLCQLAGAEDLRTERLQAERKACRVLVQQHTGDLKLPFCLLLLQIGQEILGQSTDPVGDKHHIRVLKALLLHEPQGLLERGGVIGVAAQKRLCRFQHVFPVKLPREEKVRLEFACAGKMDHGKAPLALDGDIQQGQSHRLAPGSGLFRSEERRGGKECL